MTTVEFNPKACEQCRHFSCVCPVLAAHERGCFLRIATACAVPIACDPHGRDVCPVCDPCTCQPSGGGS